MGRPHRSVLSFGLIGMRHLSTVRDRFEITGIGCALVPGMSETWPKNLPIRRGDSIELRRPDGTSLWTRIQSVEICDRIGGHSEIAILLPPEIEKTEVPVGTEIWREDP